MNENENDGYVSADIRGEIGMLFRDKTEKSTSSRMGDWTQGLGEDIRRLLFAGDMLEVDFSVLVLLLDVQEFNIEVFRSIAVHVVLYVRYCRCAISQEHRWTCQLSKGQRRQKMTNVIRFSCGFVEGDDFAFRRRLRDF